MTPEELEAIKAHADYWRGGPGEDLVAHIDRLVAEVKKLQREDARLIALIHHLTDAEDRAELERDAARAEVERLQRERDAARAAFDALWGAVTEWVRPIPEALVDAWHDALVEGEQ